MRGITVLVIEDNPTARKMLRATLECEGTTVLEASDGRTALAQMERKAPDLVLQDLCLPDMPGIELVRQLRRLPGGSDVPMIALSGFLERLEEARSVSAGFTAFLVKPIEPSRLVEVIRAHLPQIGGPVPQTGRSRRILVVDDEPVQRKLLKHQICSHGFQVETASDGSEALASARSRPPDAIVSDVLMPGLDGFELCLEVRRDPRLARVPLVLVSSHFVEEEDQKLAMDVGANALVPRLPLADLVVDALAAALETEPPQPIEPVEMLKSEHTHRLIRQLERQVGANTGLVHACALQAAQLGFFRRISAVMGFGHGGTMRDALAACLDAAGVSRAAIYLANGEGPPVFQHAVGFEDERETELATFFGRPELIEGVLEDGASVALPSANVPPDVAGEVLARAGSDTGLIVPLVADGTCAGAIFLASHGTDVTRPEAVSFAENLAGQIGHAIALFNAHLQAAASRERYRVLVENANDAVSVLGPDGSILEVNRRFEEILQVPRDQIVGRHIREFAAPGRAEENVRSYLESIQAGGGKDAPVQLARADGALITMEFTTSPMEINGERVVLRIGRDVTEQLRMQAQLMQSDRMASIGMMAAGVAHEINNPLACVIGNLDLASRQLNELEKQQGLTIPGALADEVRDAHDAAERIRLIVRDLKMFSRSEDERRGAVDVKRVLESSLQMAWNEIRHRARLVKIMNDVPYVNGNESRLGQVFLNLMINAAQAIPEGRVDRNEIRIATGVDAGGRVMVEIGDTGCGMPQEVLDRIFLPFFTTKQIGVGTGLGLSICQRIVTAMGGEIAVVSEAGKGTTFRVFLPAAKGGVVPEDAPPKPAPMSAGRRARVLVVDDEPMITDIVCRILEAEHDVTALTSAQAALDQIIRGERYDVILCDLMMPHMTGMDLHAAMLVAAPGQAERMVFLTGGAFTSRARSFMDQVMNQRIEKPFDPMTLRSLVTGRVR